MNTFTKIILLALCCALIGTHWVSPARAQEPVSPLKMVIGEPIDATARVIRDIKILLKARGFDTGPINSELNEGTKAALRAYSKESDTQLDTAGLQALLEKLTRISNPDEITVEKFQSEDGCEITVAVKDNGDLEWKEMCSAKSGWNPVAADGSIQLPGGIPVR